MPDLMSEMPEGTRETLRATWGNVYEIATNWDF